MINHPSPRLRVINHPGLRPPLRRGELRPQRYENQPPPSVVKGNLPRDGIAPSSPPLEGNLDHDGAVGIGAFLSWGIEIIAICTISIFDTKIVRALARFFICNCKKIQLSRFAMQIKKTGNESKNLFDIQPTVVMFYRFNQMLYT